MARSASLTRAAFRSRRKARTPEEVEARRLLTARSGGTCEGCGRAPATDAAHRIARSQGGAWGVANLLHACRACHQWQHAHPVMARSVGWTVRGGQDPAATPVHLVVGVVLLDDRGSYQPAPTERTA